MHACESMHGSPQAHCTVRQQGLAGVKINSGAAPAAEPCRNLPVRAVRELVHKNMKHYSQHCACSAAVPYVTGVC